MLNIQHFTKTYGEKKAVDDLSLHIAPGEIYGFIGHNGAGKTTTLKAAVGILQFDAGEITIGGHSIKTEPLACKQLLAYIPDNPDLYDFMSGIQYLNFIADIFGIPAAERWARIEPYADAFELTGDLGQPISAYSHGMKQKLAIIAAWIHDPKLVIMDEPFVGLDQGAAQAHGHEREYPAEEAHHQQCIQRDVGDRRALGAHFVLFRVVEIVAEDLRHLFFQQRFQHDASSSSRNTSSRLSSPLTSSIVPERISRPPLMMATLSQSFSATSSTCVEKKIAPPASHSSRIMPLSKCAALGSRPTKGSSMMISLG